MATQKSGQTRFPTMKLPKPIVSIHNAVDIIEKAKKKRAAAADEITNAKAKLATLLKRHKKKLGIDSKTGAVVYRLNGYRVVLSQDEKVDAKVEKES